MRFVKESIEAASAPADLNVESRVEHGKHALDRPEGDRVEMTAFEQGDERLRHTGRFRQLGLRQTASLSQGSKRPPNPLVVHAADDRQRRFTGRYRRYHWASLAVPSDVPGERATALSSRDRWLPSSIANSSPAPRARLLAGG
jgi:hypothetical protein